MWTGSCPVGGGCGERTPRAHSVRPPHKAVVGAGFQRNPWSRVGLLVRQVMLVGPLACWLADTANRQESEQTPGDSEGQRLECCSPWGRRVM